MLLKGEEMKDKSEERVEGQKKPYLKPEVRKVTLRPEEAVLGACKTTSPQTGPAAANCGNPIYCYTHSS
jgi:hypothetical protein